jgi:hypothetical protein
LYAHVPELGTVGVIWNGVAGMTAPTWSKTLVVNASVRGMPKKIEFQILAVTCAFLALTSNFCLPRPIAIGVRTRSVQHLEVSRQIQRDVLDASDEEWHRWGHIAAPV